MSMIRTLEAEVIGLTLEADVTNIGQQGCEIVRLRCRGSEADFLMQSDCADDIQDAFDDIAIDLWQEEQEGDDEGDEE